jgi:glutaredoxin
LSTYRLLHRTVQIKAAEQSEVDWGTLKKVTFEEKPVETEEVEVEAKKTERRESKVEIPKRQAPVLVST